MTHAEEAQINREMPYAKVAMCWFLASEVMTFGGFLTAYVLFRAAAQGGWGPLAAHLNPVIATINTVVLLTSSLTIVKAHQAMLHDDQQKAKRLLGITALLGIAFLGLKAVEYSIELSHGYTPVTHIFWSFYYVLTGLHALHMVAGIVVNLVLRAHAAKGKLTLARAEAAGLYWHFVDIVWVFLFPLLYLSY
ncbi:MAG: heme-copper oxidase subunit III [Candidatus Poribacteria bacterium]